MKEFLTVDGKYRVTRLSRWITVQDTTITKRSSLWDYAEDENGYHPYQDEFNPSNGCYIRFFRWNGYKLALNRFYALGSMVVSGCPYEFTDTDGKSTFVSAVDMDGNLLTCLNPRLCRGERNKQKCRG